MPPGCQPHFTPRLRNQAYGTPRGAKMAPRKVSPVSSGGHLSQCIIQGVWSDILRKSGWEDVELEMSMSFMNIVSLIIEFCFFMGVVKYRNWEELVSDLATQQPEVKFLSGPLDSISFDLQANSDWMHTGAAHPPAFTLLCQCLNPTRARNREPWWSWGRTWTWRWKDRGKKGDR